MSETFKAGDKVWHPKTKLFGTVIDQLREGSIVTPPGHVVVEVQDPIVGPMPFVWSVESLELLDEEEFALTEALVKWKRRKTELNKEVKEAGSEYAAAETNMIEYLLRMAQQGTRHYAGIGQVTIDGKNIHASITEENKEIAFKEIEEMGRGEIIKRSVHPSTLEAFVSELQDTGVAVPKHISVYETPKLSFAKKK